MIQTIGRTYVPKFLDKVEAYNTNPRYNRAQFEKYLNSEKAIDSLLRSLWLGNFDDDGNLQALAYCNKQPTKSKSNNLTSDFICLAEVQSFTKGFGKPLIEHIVNSASNLWLVQDFEGGEELEAYYKQFSLKEVTIPNCVFNLQDTNFFYKAVTDADEKVLLTFLDRFRS